MLGPYHFLNLSPALAIVQQIFSLNALFTEVISRCIYRCIYNNLVISGCFRSTLFCGNHICWSPGLHLHCPAIPHALCCGDSLSSLLLSHSPKKLIWPKSFSFMLPVSNSEFLGLVLILHFSLLHLCERNLQHSVRSNTVSLKSKSCPGSSPTNPLSWKEETPFSWFLILLLSQSFFLIPHFNFLHIKEPCLVNCFVQSACRST